MKLHRKDPVSTDNIDSPQQFFRRLKDVHLKDTKAFLVDGEMVVDFGSASYFKSRRSILEGPVSFSVYRGKFKFGCNYEVWAVFKPHKEGDLVKCRSGYGYEWYEGTVVKVIPSSRHASYDIRFVKDGVEQVWYFNGSDVFNEYRDGEAHPDVEELLRDGLIELESYWYENAQELFDHMREGGCVEV